MSKPLTYFEEWWDSCGSLMKRSAVKKLARKAFDAGRACELEHQEAIASNDEESMDRVIEDQVASGVLEEDRGPNRQYNEY
jgi:hypothetical protein